MIACYLYFFLQIILPLGIQKELDLQPNDELVVKVFSLSHPYEKIKKMIPKRMFGMWNKNLGVAETKLTKQQKNK